MRKNRLVILFIMLLGSFSMFGQGTKVVETDDFTFEIPSSWSCQYYGQDVGGMIMEYMILAEDNATNVILQSTVADTSAMTEEDFLSAMAGVISAMADDFEVLVHAGNRIVYCVELQGVKVVQDLYCCFVKNKVYIFASSSALETYGDYIDIFDAIYGSVEF